MEKIKKQEKAFYATETLQLQPATLELVMPIVFNAPGIPNNCNKIPGAINSSSINKPLSQSKLDTLIFLPLLVNELPFCFSVCFCVVSSFNNLSI